jgi:translation elongation factor EF-Tu-like GTPase
MRRYLALTLMPLALLAAGCSAVEDAASDAASQAVSDITDAAVQEVTTQICGVVEDGAISASEQQVLSGLVAAAETAGAPESMTGPLNQVAQAGDEVPAEAMRQLSATCDRSTQETGN